MAADFSVGVTAQKSLMSPCCKPECKIRDGFFKKASERAVTNFQKDSTCKIIPELDEHKASSPAQKSPGGSFAAQCGKSLHSIPWVPSLSHFELSCSWAERVGRLVNHCPAVMHVFTISTPRNVHSSTPAIDKGDKGAGGMRSPHLEAHGGESVPEGCLCLRGFCMQAVSSVAC